MKRCSSLRSLGLKKPKNKATDSPLDVSINFSDFITQIFTDECDDPLNDSNDVPEVQRPANASYFPDDSVFDQLDKVDDFCEVVSNSFFGLPLRVKNLIRQYKGIDKLYDWQEACLSLPAIKARKNLIYTLPTSGGKTLVAEVLMLKELFCCDKNVIFVLPFVALVQEKVRSLAPFALDLGFLVEEYAGGKGTLPPRKRRHKKAIFICTIEKGLALVQSLLENGRFDEVGMIVVDELHLLSEGSGRGAALEATLTYVMHSNEKCQIIGMSATIGNLREIASFVNAEVFSGDFRPVELTEYVKCGNTVYRVEAHEEDAMVHVRTLLSPNSGSDPDGIGELVREVCPLQAVLIFCPTKKNCENIALLLSKQLPRNFLEHLRQQKMDLLESLSSEVNGRICPVLKESLAVGVAYHHSGLTADERKLIEEAYREGILCCICCTSTLAAGVNLPAQRVILRAPFIGRDLIKVSQYKQMVGRAGRAGLGNAGESYLICQAKDTSKVGELLRSKMDDALSSLTDSDIENMIISAVGLDVAKTKTELHNFFLRTLLHVQAERRKVNVTEMVDRCIETLRSSKALVTKLDSQGDASSNSGAALEERFSISPIARAALKGNMTLETAIVLQREIKQSITNFVLNTDLHLIYLVTPYEASANIIPNTSVLFDVYMQLSAKEQHAAKVIGITERHASRMALGQKPKDLAPEIVNKFYISLILNELFKHGNIWDVASLFQISRGQVQNLMAAASGFSWKVLRFCEELNLWRIKALLTEFAPRLAHCCEAELLPLMELPAIKRARARQLYHAGYKTLQLIARSEPSDLVSAIQYLPKKTATQIVAAAKLLLLEKAESLKEEAEDLLEGV